MILLLILAVPLAAGALSFAARKRPAMEAINLGAFAAVFLLAVALAARVLRAGSISAWSGFLRADSLSALVVLLTAFVALICAVYAVGYFREDERNRVFEEDMLGAVTISKLRKYYALTPLFVFSMLLVALADNLGVMWVAVEATTLTSVFLVTFYGRATSLEAAWKYAIIGGVGLSMALLGTILTYYSAHPILESETLAGLNWSVMVVHASQFDKTTMKLAFILILLGYGTKAGVAPMHTWKPDAYSEAPVPAAAILSSATLNCALYGLVRFYILASRCLDADYPGRLLLLFGVLSMGISVPFVLIQRNFRRLLAYHTIDHAGIMVTALGVGGPLGALGLTLHMTFHTVAKSLLFLCAGTVLPPFEGERHVYRPTLGEGVFQIPVGPVHAGIIEPGHFNFAVAGEPILYLQLRMFYVHKGIEKRFEQLPVSRAVYLAESISGDSSFSHGTAFCQAIEQATEVEIPERARRMRTILLELERIYNHVADIGAIATDVGFVIANAHASRLREMILCLNEELTGSRLLRGMVCPGGVRWDWNSDQIDGCVDILKIFEQEFRDLMRIIETSNSTRDRLERTGILRPDQARDLGIVGVAGRASGVDRDVRRDHPYAAYDSVSFQVPVYQEGDVLRRLQVRVDEIRKSLSMIRAMESGLRPGPHCAFIPPLPPDRCALGAVEGWRGEILHWIRTGPHNRLERCKIKDPSINNWPALVEAVQGNIVPDFPVINKSFNLSYSGTDR